MTEKVQFPDGEIRDIEPAAYQMNGRGPVPGMRTPVFDILGYDVVEAMGSPRWHAIRSREA